MADTLKVYLLWKIDPHDDLTAVVAVYNSRESADKAIPRFKEICKETVDVGGKPWFSFCIDEREIEKND